jgi:GMP synthase-like glutamine amidotransferase
VRVTVIADREDADAGFVGERLDQQGASIRRVWRDEPASYGDALGTCDLVVLLGSDRSVHDASQQAVVSAESDLVREADRRALPLLAICYGAQLVASAFGASVRRSPVPEIGWRRIECASAAPFGEGPWFEFHYDRWASNAPLELLARTAAAPQAFRLRRVLATQFHPEVTAATAHDWLIAGRRSLERAGLDLDAIDAATRREEPGARLRCYHLVDRFLEDFVGSPVTDAVRVEGPWPDVVSA